MKPHDSSRRFFLKKASIGTIAVTSGMYPYSLLASGSQLQDNIRKGKILNLSPDSEKNLFKPLDDISIDNFKQGIIQVIDGNGNLYIQEEAKKTFSYKIGGALGVQTVLLLNKKGELLDWATYKVDAETSIEDEGNRYKNLLEILYWSLIGEMGIVDSQRYNGKIYEFFVRWLRDHVHTMKGMKYFYPNLKSAIELYADTQQDNGMIYDNIHKRDIRPNYWEKRFMDRGFMEISDDKKAEMKRIPVENDVEFLFIEGIYYTWKATGDTEWMKGLLDKALKAVEYSTTSEYRWSKKYQLLKRGRTIDTWDFQSDVDSVVNGDSMVIDKDKTEFGVMFGDNTGMAASLSYLSEMLEVANRSKEAEKIKKLELGIRERLNKLSWNGNYFRHHVPENENLVRDFGVDLEKQVSLSNSYSINRGIKHEQAVAIIKTYQRIRKEMPKSSPGEWYTIYPPFEKGYGGHNSKWDYMNGGVISITAGELAHGAFEHGFEAYGTDILDRITNLAKKTDNYLHCTYRGMMPDTPKRNLVVI